MYTEMALVVEILSHGKHGTFIDLIPWCRGWGGGWGIELVHNWTPINATKIKSYCYQSLTD